MSRFAPDSRDCIARIPQLRPDRGGAAPVKKEQVPVRLRFNAGNPPRRPAAREGGPLGLISSHVIRRVQGEA